MAEMDSNIEIKLPPEGVKYKATNQQVFKEVQDPFGKLDLVNGGWEDRGADAGRNVIYDFENFERRFCVTGGATGWCWLNFREKD